MDPVRIEYRIKLNDEKTERFRFKLDGETFNLITRKIPNPPKWTELTFKQCGHCPLSSEKHSHCPVALQLYDIVRRFHDTKSIDEVRLMVVTEERRVMQILDLQRAIASMLDLVIPICGCPKTTYMKPMARFHLPLASEEETVFRVTGMYLLAQYFVSQQARDTAIGFDGLAEIYDDLHTLNAAVASRLQNATMSDSVKNAITLVDMYSMLVPVLLEDQLVEMRSFFEAYLPKDETVKEKPVAKTKLEQAKAFRLELVPLSDDTERTEEEKPDWLREITTSSEMIEEPEQEQEDEADKRKQEAIDSILSKSSLNLELEPMVDSDSTEEQESDHPVSGKAVFQLPDD